MNELLSNPDTNAISAEPLRWGLQAADQPTESEWGRWSAEDRYLNDNLLKAANCGILGLQTRFASVIFSPASDARDDCDFFAIVPRGAAR